ncbi:AAA domain-containing protein [Pedobacter sp. ok626]|nr:AAA domain-containing protein [Pedobacter sp. ok626]
MDVPALIKTVDFLYTPSINFALQQNHVASIRGLTITNTSDKPWEELKVEISSEPEFTAVWSDHIGELQVGEIFQITSRQLDISPKFLVDLTEKMIGKLILRLYDKGNKIFEESYPIELLAFDQWPGVGMLPEMLAAFIMPNHPDIPKIIRRASQLLEQWTGSPSFDEYQSKNPNRVRNQMAAIYEAISELQIVYCSVPASFEQQGQRVRLLDTIFLNKLANCLDLSLLFAACLESVGIHPFIVVIKGHAFTGGWLIDESFADAINDDPSLLTKRAVEGITEIALLEATCMNAGGTTSFDQAVSSADQKMLNTDEFLFFIDVKRARFGGVRPLPLRIATSSGWEIEETVPRERVNLSPEVVAIGQKLVAVDRIDVSKQRMWERKLLDLTLRNSLLNVRMTKSVIQFITVDTGKLEDALANGEEFQILGKPSDWNNSARDSGVYQSVHHSDPIADLVGHELSHKRLRTYLSDLDLGASMTHLYRSSRTAMEENGANTLFIGLGMLKWYETDASERARYAPILLLPVEIIRKSAQKGYVIRSREEDTIMNITLLEMIRQDFGITIGGLDTLPKDESGVDVKAIFNIIRQAIMSKSRWDVEEQALLGTFSFNKFILWNDIHNNASQLCRNKVVASLVSGKLEWQPEENATLTEISDGLLHPSTVALPISTDSSQLQAIISSAQGKSFVLHGPPGTGKSQTITNIIANALYAGKKVLFVAAKKAALEVVEKRLESIGIGAFCLELHSNKTKKSAVLEQLKASTEIARSNAPENFSLEADRLFELRNEINIYVESLHRKYPFGFSLYELFSAYSQLEKKEQRVFFSTADIEGITPKRFGKWKDVVEEIHGVGNLIRHPKGHALELIELLSYSPGMKQELKELLGKYLEELKEVFVKQEDAAQVMWLSGQVKTAEQEDAFVDLLTILLELSDFSASLLETGSFEQMLAQVVCLVEHGLKRDAIRVELLRDFSKDILTIPASKLLIDWNIAADKWFLPRWLAQNKMLKHLKSISLTGKVEKAGVPGLLISVNEYQQEQEVIDAADYLGKLLGFLWLDGNPDWKGLEEICKGLIQANRLAAKLVGSVDLKLWRDQLANAFTEGSQMFFSTYKKVLKGYVIQIRQLRSTEVLIEEKLGVNLITLKESVSVWNKYITLKANSWLENIEDLKDWYSWCLVRQQAIAEGLQPLVSPYENGSISTSDIPLQFYSGFYRSAAEYIIEQNPALATFNGGLFEEKIKRFRVLSKNFEELTKKELYARLAAKIPSFTQEAAQSSEIGLLQRAIRNNGRAQSIRKIFDSIPNLLPRISPCMLMSPISVAQYFDADSVKFDLVIFDEASQMPTCEAVGAIARATNVIVVGDPKQMPPTNFFSTNNVDEDNIEKEDLESILDDCLALSMPSQHLLWHYRSKHESLIAFSNAKYYENKLLTFPSTDDIISKVQFVPVKGFYDKGKTRQNAAEAKAIVGEVVARLSDETLSRKSIGIVTFSSVQQSLIEDLLTDVYKLRPDLERIALECEEPIFIKNLENVQGDERDVILFSIGYGPDENNNVSLNFGPINREGGWRRLNVAVSRARYEMKVFSTLSSDRIDLNRTSSEGVAGLKAFLAYAEKGKIALPIRNRINHEQAFSFEGVIADEIAKHGFTVHAEVGCSEYKIDLAVVDPDHPEEYILAILTDGRNYHQANNSKDREITQVEVLGSLGWNIHKIWSAEWWEKPEKVISGILEAIRLADEKKKNKVVEAAVSASVTKEFITPIFEEPLQRADVERVMVAPIQVSSAVSVYQVAELDNVNSTFPDEFLADGSRGKIKTQILMVLAVESPISKNLLGKRIISSWGIGRMGTRLTYHLQTLFDELGLVSSSDLVKEIFWKKEHNPEEYSAYRTAGTDLQKRDAEDLPVLEVANGIHDILKNQISLPETELIREGAKLFGYSRVGANVEMVMHLGVKKAIEKGFAYELDNRIILKEST